MGRAKRFIADDSGASAVEYGILITMVGLALVISLEVVGVSFSDLMSDSADKIDNATSNP